MLTTSLKLSVFIAALLLVGCGDTISQSASGSGTNIIAGEDVEGSGNDIFITPEEQASDEVVEFTDDDPNCSVGSREEGRC